MMGFGYGMGGWGGFGWLGSLLFLTLIVLGIIYLWRALDSGRGHRTQHDAANGTPRPGEDSALRILRERYARGEIDEEEFDRRKEGLA
jgi:putative membrane protein